MPVEQISDQQWRFTGHLTTGVINRVRDGLVTRYVASNSNNQTSPMMGSTDTAARWLRANDTRG